MSEQYNKLVQFKLTPDNHKSLVDLQKQAIVKVSIAALGNACLELGVKEYRKKMKGK